MPISKFVLDASVWIEYLEGTIKGLEIKNIIENDSSSNITSAVTVAEVISKVLRLNQDAELALTHINNFSIVIELTQELGIAAGKIHVEAKKKNKEFGMLDAFVVATARKLNAKILTIDSDFKPFKETVFV